MEQKINPMLKKILFILLVGSLATQVKSQCGDALIDVANAKLEEATYLNVFRVLLKKGKKDKLPVATYRVKLSKGNIYRFVTADAQENKTFTIARLSDDLKIYGESYDSFEDVNYGGFDFRCQKTGTYYLTAYFKDGQKGCAVVVMALLKVYDKGFIRN